MAFENGKREAVDRLQFLALEAPKRRRQERSAAEEVEDGEILCGNAHAGASLELHVADGAAEGA